MLNGKRLIVLCASRVYEPQIHGFIVKLNENLRKAGYSLLIFTLNSDIYWEEHRQASERYVFDLIPYEYIDGIIIMDEKIKSRLIAKKIIRHAGDYNIPVVIADGKYDGATCINFAYEDGFEQVVRHVIEFHNVRKPHIMAGHPDNDFSNRRIEVFKKVLEENDIPFDSSMISYGYFWADPCIKATRKLLERHELPEAIICANDIMAVTVSELLSSSGVLIPDDVIVTGFDGYDEIYFNSPMITTASCDLMRLADVTFDTLMKVIDGSPHHDVMIMPKFIPNESCGCPGHTEHPHILRDWFKESFARNNNDNRILQWVASSMQLSETPGELASNMESDKTTDLLVAVDRKCFDTKSNYFTDSMEQSEPKEFVLLFDADHPENYKKNTYVLPPHENYYVENVLSPVFRDRILELTESGYPIIFNSLDFMNRSFGFVAYYFRNYQISHYSNTMSATNSISMGIGGYINTQYQRNLLYKMDEMYRHDSLTGLYNRIGFQRYFTRFQEDPQFSGHNITIIMSDLDGLKYINDHFGHAEGDRAIAAVAKALQTSVPAGSLTTRFGGDEIFSVVFADTDPDEVMRNIDLYLAEYNIKSGLPYMVSASSGYIVTRLSPDFDIIQAIRRADEKMYLNKNRKYSLRKAPGTTGFHRERATKLISKLTLSDKLALLYGTTEERASLGMRFYEFFGEAAHGVQARHDQSFDKGAPVCTTVFPNPIGMAASFDKDIMHRIGDTVGTEMRSLLNEGLHNCACAFAPTIDMERDPRWGRNEEGYGEDPHLASRMAGEYILGMAGNDRLFIRCGATLKHFYGNNNENTRYSANANIPEDLKRDYYLRVFEEIIAYSHPASLMTAYNMVNGTSSAFNPEVNELARMWGIPFVVSDAFSLSYTVEKHGTAASFKEALSKALASGVDSFLENHEIEKPAMEEALSEGLITEDDLDKALTHRAIIYSMLGLMNEDLEENNSSKHFPRSEYNRNRVDTAESRALAREAASESAVLLKNENLLPLKEDDNIFLFGPFADCCPPDWYGGLSSHTVTLAEAMGVPSFTLMPRVRIKLGESYAVISDRKLAPSSDGTAEIFRIMLWDDSRITIRSESTGKLLTTRSPESEFINDIQENEDFTLYAAADEAFSWFTNEAFQMIDENGDIIHFNADNAYRFWEDSRIKGISGHGGSLVLDFETVSDVDALLKEASESEKMEKDSRIVACFGLHPIVNCKEERDRDSIELPPFQRAVLRKIRESFDQIALLLMANAPVAITEEDSSDEIKAILWTATGSEELGNGIADILYGKISPAGRLPQTWYRDDSQLADIEDYDIRKNHMTYLYMEEEPLYRFGYGLTYSEFECSYGNAGGTDNAEDKTQSGTASNNASLPESREITIKNVGNSVSDYVIQVYKAPDGTEYLYGNDRLGKDVYGRKIPVGSRLVRFERLHDLKPGETIIF